MTDGTKRRSRNRRGEGGRLREEIVETAMRLVEGEGGARAVTLRAIAREVGIATTSIYSHFADVDEVMEAVTVKAFGELADLLGNAAAAETDPVARLRAVCHTYVALGAQHPRTYHLLFSEGPRSPAEKSADTTPGADAFHFLREGISACVAAGRSTSRDPDQDATALWTAMHGYVILQTGEPAAPSPPDDHLVDHLVDLFVDRLAQLTPPPA
jgi:AcrR family transcriptional regulator